MLLTVGCSIAAPPHFGKMGSLRSCGIAAGVLPYLVPVPRRGRPFSALQRLDHRRSPASLDQPIAARTRHKTGERRHCAMKGVFALKFVPSRRLPMQHWVLGDIPKVANLGVIAVRQRVSVPHAEGCRNFYSTSENQRVLLWQRR